MSEAIFIHDAFKRGDLETPLVVLDNPPGMINTPNSDAFGHCLEYAFCDSPMLLIRQLLEPVRTLIMKTMMVSHR